MAKAAAAPVLDADPAADLITFEELLALDDLPVMDLTIPEWRGKQVRIGTLTQAQRTQSIHDATVGGPQGEHIDPDLLDKYTVLHSLKAPQLTSLEQVNALWNKNAAAMQRIRTACVRWNKLDTASQEALVATFRAQARSAAAV